MENLNTTLESLLKVAPILYSITLIGLAIALKLILTKDNPLDSLPVSNEINIVSQPTKGIKTDALSSKTNAQRIKHIRKFLTSKIEKG